MVHSLVFLFVYRDNQFANLSVPFQNDMPLDTHESAKSSGVQSYPNSLSNFAISYKPGFSSGVIELIDAQFYGGFHLCKVNILPEKLCSVLSGGVPMLAKGKQHRKNYNFA